MRRPASALAVDPTLTDKSPSASASVVLIQSPQSSTTALHATSTFSLNASTAVEQTYTPPRPSIRLLFSLISRHDVLLLLLPALVFSVISGGIAPFMTIVIGQAFDAFAAYSSISNPTESAKHHLLEGVGTAALELVGLAVGALALSCITSCLWIWVGERNALRLRKKVYGSVTEKEMIWFDTKLGAEGAIQAGGADGPVGAGGLMAQFARETDEVRMASSLASGMLVQYVTTSITALVLAFIHSWSLTLVILSTVPLLVLIQALSQIFVTPPLSQERAQTAVAATLVDRAVAAIATVKAFNAQLHEISAIAVILDRMHAAAQRCHTVFGLSSAFSQFFMMAMFVQGFWFGSKLVREGQTSAGDVMAVFWACLIATSNLQMCIPQLVILTKGKVAMASLIKLVEEPVQAPPSRASFTFPSSPGVKKHIRHKRKSAELRRIIPNMCEGEFALHNVTFAYPSRPTQPVLQDVSLYFPAQEMTFVVGGSGSGKSTIAQLLLRMYEPSLGQIQLDDQDIYYLDKGFTRAHVAAVTQGSGMLFDMSVHDNVAMGLGLEAQGQEVSREAVVDACRVALMHEFVRDLPEGYNTKLGNGGANLSGGQRQRLAIARARLRNPTVLILDEATSALDATSRLLVFEAIKRWRRNKTTIVITHDLSQIESGDFVYVLKSGQVIEQGYRSDLERAEGGELRALMEAQGATGGYLPERDLEEKSVNVELEVEMQRREQEKAEEESRLKGLTFKHLSKSLSRPITMGNWMFDAVADLTKPAMPREKVPTTVGDRIPAESSEKEGISAFDDPENRSRRPSTFYYPTTPPPAVARPSVAKSRSLQLTPTSPSWSLTRDSWAVVNEQDAETEAERAAMQDSAAEAARRRAVGGDTKTRVRQKWEEARLAELKSVQVQSSAAEEALKQEQPTTFWRLMREIFPSIPYKPALFMGLLVCVISGAMTPIFSFLLSRLLFEVSIGARDTSTINKFGGIVLAIAAADGVFMGLKFVIMENLAIRWVTKIRKTCLNLVVSQDKKWFDKSENSSVRLMSILIKDGDDARSLVAIVWAQCVVVVAMLGVGLIWALVNGWQFTLVGLAIAPVFAISMAVQTNLCARFELRNKRAREEVAKSYYEVVSNIRGIRSMGFDNAFRRQFDETVDKALLTGVRGAFVEGCTYGVASALIYLAEALLFYVGAVLIARGLYTYLQMVETLNLIVFTVTLGGQLMAFTNRIAKSVQATSDFNRLLKLSNKTDESHGSLRPELDTFVNLSEVSFSYPERPDVQVLKNLSADIAEGECVAVVGASGSGKSTIAALLQRLYEPDSGAAHIGAYDLKSLDVQHLRWNVAVVSQNPNLFDGTIRENIAYGTDSLSDADIHKAAEAANVHDFIMSLPKGYNTVVGENASLISGGQAQRIQIARALARPSKLLILDECTSALDAANQVVVMETIRRAKVGRTTVMVTHKIPMMRMCDRILVVDEGRIVEDGPYDELVKANGAFARLASAGEWFSD